MLINEYIFAIVYCFILYEQTKDHLILGGKCLFKPQQIKQHKNGKGREGYVTNNLLHPLVCGIQSAWFHSSRSVIAIDRPSTLVTLHHSSP